MTYILVFEGAGVTLRIGLQPVEFEGPLQMPLFKGLTAGGKHSIDSLSNCCPNERQYKNTHLPSSVLLCFQDERSSNMCLCTMAWSKRLDFRATYVYTIHTQLLCERCVVYCTVKCHS